MVFYKDSKHICAYAHITSYQYVFIGNYLLYVWHKYTKTLYNHPYKLIFLSECLYFVFTNQEILRYNTKLSQSYY